MSKFKKNVCILILELVITIALGHYLFEYVNPWLSFATYIIGVYLIIKSIINLINEKENENEED